MVRDLIDFRDNKLTMKVQARYHQLSSAESNIQICLRDS